MEQLDARVIDDEDNETTVRAWRDADRLLVDADGLRTATGWTLKPEGLCHGEVCVPAHRRPDLVEDVDGAQRIDLAVWGELVGVPTVVDAGEGIAAFGTSVSACRERTATGDAPEFVVDDLDGNPVALKDFAGRKKMLVAFASWCGCRYDLPAWQAMHEELAPHGFSVIGVAVDERAEDVREWVADVEFPVVLDRDHVITDRYDIRNVPTVVWIDEDDKIARPNDAAFGSDMFKEFNAIDSAPHHEALRRWVVEGAPPMTEGAPPRPVERTAEDQLARVHWRVAIALHRDGRTDAAARHFDRAGELAPVDLTIRRSQMPLRDIDPFLSPEFFDLYAAYLDADRPGYAFEHPKPDV